MDWIQFAILFITFVGLFIWNRTESRADIRHMDQKLESNRNLSLTIHEENQKTIEIIRKETQGLIETNRRETQGLIEAIRQDIKDFHGRLCAIEEKYRAKP